MSTVPGKNKKSVTIAGLGCHRRRGKHHRRSKWSKLGELSQLVYETFLSNIVNEFSELSLLRPFQGFNPCGTRACPG